MNSTGGSLLGPEYWLNLSSNANQRHIYPSNRPNKFTIKLPVPLHFFNANYKVALWYISVPTFWNVINERNNKFCTRKRGETTKQRVQLPGTEARREIIIPPPPINPIFVWTESVPDGDSEALDPQAGGAGNGEIGRAHV